MQRVQLTINGSWQQFVGPLTDLIPFVTHGNLRGVVGHHYTTGRLPSGWKDLYNTQADCNIVAYTVLSYDTPIAWCVRSDNATPLWWFPGVSYSVTTSKTQGRIATALSTLDVTVRDSLLPVPRPQVDTPLSECIDQYAVWYASVGCLPDSEGPDFTGSLEDCEAWIASQVAEGVPALGEPSDHDGNLYRFTIEPWEDEQSCVTCGDAIRWIDCPTGGWWQHHTHPSDDHDAHTHEES